MMSFKEIEESIITNTDSYKPTHYPIYPPGTEYIYSYFESRGGEYAETVFFGLQYILKKYFNTPTKNQVEYASELFKDHFGTDKIFNEKGWLDLIKDYPNGLPLCIKAVPEGSVIPIKNVLMTVQNTNPKYAWLTNYVETVLVRLWYPITVATISRECKKIILQSLKETGDESLIDFKLHDFGSRGVSSMESAGIGGLAHLVNFKGSDTLNALLLSKLYYHCSMAGFSIPATEHSTITSWEQIRETLAYDKVLTEYPDGLVACVIDSWDTENACKVFGTTLKEKILERKGTLVLRPDSGVPQDVVLQCLTSLGKYFGYTVNEKGYKVLDPHVRLIQGDGVNIESIKLILDKMKLAGWSADNIAFGMGGGLLQQCNRDTQKFAFKCSWTKNSFGEIDVYKNPITDPGKASKKGKLGLKYNPNDGYTTVPEWAAIGKENILQTVYNNGFVAKEFTLDEIRERAKINTK